MDISFNLNALQANSEGLSSDEHWANWANTLEWPLNEKIVAPSIPPMMRRRMSKLSKLAVHTAVELLKQHAISYLVFSSRHGELHRSAQLIEDILLKNDISPTAFSQSVHNTAAGLTTIVEKKPIPFTSITASEETFSSALLEGWLYLESNPSEKVLVLDFDDPLPQIYQEFEQESYRSYALGLVMSKGSQFSTSAQKSNQHKAAPRYQLPPSMLFLKHYLLGHKHWETSTSQYKTTWHKNEHT